MSICILLLDWWFIIYQKTKPKVKESRIFTSEKVEMQIQAKQVPYNGKLNYIQFLTEETLITGSIYSYHP